MPIAPLSCDAFRLPESTLPLPLPTPFDETARLPSAADAEPSVAPTVLETLLSESSRLPEPIVLPDWRFRLSLPEPSDVIATLPSAAEAELLSELAVLSML